MENKELEELLKKDIPNAVNLELNSKEVLQKCKEKAAKNKIVIKRISVVLSSFAIVLLVIFGSILLNNKINEDVIKINRSIVDLGKIGDDEQRMIEIVKLGKEIESFSSGRKTKINTQKLSQETTSTATSLKNSVEWKDYINHEDPYYTLDSIIDISQIQKMRIIIDGFAQGGGSEERIDDDEFNESFIKLIDIPYIDVLELEKNDTTIVDMLRKQSSGSGRTSPYYLITIIEDIYEYEFMVHPRGYVIINIVDLSDNYGKIKQYISLVRVDFNEFIVFLSSDNLNNYNKELLNYNNIVELFTDEYISSHAIKSLVIIPSIYSSTIYNVREEEDINIIISLIYPKEILFEKELYYLSSYEMLGIEILLTCESSDGEICEWNLFVSKEGVLKVRLGDNVYIYYSDKNSVDYIALYDTMKKLPK